MLPRRLRQTAILLFAVAPLLAQTAANPAKTGMDPERLARIPARMKAFVDRGTVPGVVTLVMRHGAVASLEAAGYQDLESKKPMRPDTIFQIMSMTKPVTAVGIMILMEEGKLAISDPVEKHLPEFKGMWVVESRDGEKSRTLVRPERPITIRDLLTHTSGMYGQVPEPLRNLYRDFDRPLSEVVAIGSQTPLDFQPGTRWQYSNIGIAALGRIIEVLADQPYEKFLAARIFEPLGMKDSFLFLPADRHGRLASLYRLEDGKLKKVDSDIFRKGSKFSMPEGGMYSTAEDLGAFYQMMLNGGAYKGRRILSKATVQMMTAVHTGDLQAGGPGMGYGLAWAVVKEPRGALSLQSIGAYGHGGAFGTYGWVDPNRDLIGVFMVQQSNSGDARNAFVALANAAVVD